MSLLTTLPAGALTERDTFVARGAVTVHSVDWYSDNLAAHRRVTVHQINWFRPASVALSAETVDYHSSQQ